MVGYLYENLYVPELENECKCFIKWRKVNFSE